MTPRHVRRGGSFYRVADPRWDDPLDPSYAAAVGGRWDPRGSFPTLYLNATWRVARANVRLKFSGLPYGPEDLDASAAPILVEATVAGTDVVDVVTDDGCTALGLPSTYPVDAAGVPVGHETCQPVGSAMHASGEPGLAVRSAAPGMSSTDEELVWFQSDADPPTRGESWTFPEWYPME